MDFFEDGYMVRLFFVCVFREMGNFAKNKVT